MGAHESAGKNDDGEGEISAVAEAVIEKHKREQSKMLVSDREVNEKKYKNSISGSTDNCTASKTVTPNAIVVEGLSNSNTNGSKVDFQTSESLHKFEPLRLFLSPNPLVINSTFDNVGSLAQEPFTQMVTPQSSDLAGNVKSVNLSNANKGKSLNPLVRRVEQSDTNTSRNDTNNANGSRRESNNNNTVIENSSNTTTTTTKKATNSFINEKSDKITSISQYCPDEFGPVVLSDEGEENMDDDNNGNDKESFYYYFLNRYGTLSNNSHNGTYACGCGGGGYNGNNRQHTITAKELLKMRHAKTASRSTQRQGTNLEGVSKVDSNGKGNDDDDETNGKSKNEKEANEEVIRSPLADFRDPVDPSVFVPALIAYTREKTKTHFFVDYNGEMRRLYHTTGWYHLKPVRQKKMIKSKSRRNCRDDDRSASNDDNDSTNETVSTISSDELESSEKLSNKKCMRGKLAQQTKQGKDTFTDNNIEKNRNASSVNAAGMAISPTKKKLTKTKSKSIFENLHEVRGVEDDFDVKKNTFKNNKKNNINKEEIDDDDEEEEEDLHTHTFPCDTHDQVKSTSNKNNCIRKSSNLVNSNNNNYRKNGSNGQIFRKRDDIDSNVPEGYANNVPPTSNWSKHTLTSKQMQRNGALPLKTSNDFFDVAFRKSPILQKVSTFSRYERRKNRHILLDDNEDNNDDDDNEAELNNHHSSSMHKLRSSLERVYKSGRPNGSWRKRQSNEFNNNNNNIDVNDECANVDECSDRYKFNSTNDKGNNRRSKNNSRNNDMQYGEDQRVTEKDSAEEYYIHDNSSKYKGIRENTNEDNYINKNNNKSEYGDDEDDDRRKMESSFNSLLSTGSGEREMLEHINLEDSIGRRVNFAEGTKYFRVSSHNELKRRLKMKRQMALEEEQREWMMQQYMLKHEHAHSRDRCHNNNNNKQKSSNGSNNNNSKTESADSNYNNVTANNDVNGKNDNNEKRNITDEETEEMKNVNNQSNDNNNISKTRTTTPTSASVANNKEDNTNIANGIREHNDG